jgi:cytochrome c oxidase subunit 4
MKLPRPYVFTWLALLALLALTTGSAFVPLGPFNVVVNFAVALAKALLVVFVFMHVRRGSPMVRVFAASGVLWLCLLVGLSLTDLAARG